MFDKAYESYKKKCKQFGIKPSSKRAMFGEAIEKIKHDEHISISELSKIRKAPAPVLSETAKKAIEVQANKKKPKLMSVKPKVIKPKKPKRVLLTEEQKRLKRNAQSKKQYKAKQALKPKKVCLTEEQKKIAHKESARKYYERTKVLKPRVIKPKIKKPKRVLLTEEQKKQNSKKRANAYYAEHKDEINSKRRALKPKKNTLSEEEKSQIKKENARLYHLKMKDDPAYKERRKSTSKNWNFNNKEKIAASNKHYRDEVRTPEQLEEKKRKQREYRQKNLEKIRAQDRARLQQRKDYIKNNPEAHERNKARDRARYVRKKADPVEAEKLREKEKNRPKRQRAAS